MLLQTLVCVPSSDSQHIPVLGRTGHHTFVVTLYLDREETWS